jgi:hypothetical protein
MIVLNREKVMKKTVKKYENCDLDYKSLEDAIEYLQELSAKFGSSATLSMEEYGATVEYSREETDDEYRVRLSTDEHHKEFRKRQYEQLKKEFGE